MTVFAPDVAPVRPVKRPTRRTQTQTRPLELFDADTLAGLRPSPMLARLGLLDPRHSKTGEPLFSAKSGKPLTQQVVDAAGNLVFEQEPVMVPESRTKQLHALAAAMLSGKSGGSQQPRAEAETEWLAKRTSNPPSGKANPGASLTEPGPAVACGFHPDLVQVQAQQSAQEFLSTRHHTSPESRGRSLEGPAAVVMPNDHHDLIQVEGVEAEFVTQYNGGSDECRNLSMAGPINTITLANRFGVVQTKSVQPASGAFLTNPGWPERCSGGSTSEPGPTLIARQDKAPLSLVQAVGTGEVGFVQKYYSSGDNVTSLNQPSGSLTCTDRMALAQVEAHGQQPAAEGAWLDKRYGSGDHNHQGLDVPGGAIMTNEKHALAQGVFLDQQYGQSGPASVENPAGSLTGTPKLNVAQTEPWIVKTDFNRVGTPLSEPSGTLTASRHYPYLAQPVAETVGDAQPTEGEWLLDNKFDNTGRPLSECGPTLLTGDHQYLAQAEPVGAEEPKNWQPQAGDSETMDLIRLFLRAYNLSDVLLRMLMVKELLAIQGFPADYVLKGSQSDAKKFIGNSVPPKMSQRITEALYEAMQEAGQLDRLTEYTGSLVVTKKGRLAESGGRLAMAA